jgi:hypothetical protein
MYCFFVLHRFLCLFKCIDETLNGTFQFVYSVFETFLEELQS